MIDTTRARFLVLAGLLLMVLASATAFAQDTLPGTSGTPPQLDSTAPPDITFQKHQLIAALVRLPLAAGLATVLALRPRRRGTPKRQAPVIQTQIILAIVGAVVMLVVGTSLARAFGIVGAAGLVRYRAKVNDPKDAGVMLSTLAIGLAAGVGVWMLAVFATVFILAVLWIIESFEKALQIFLLTVKTKDPAALKPKIEEVLARYRVEFELRAAGDEEIAYEVRLPVDKRTDRLSNAVLRLAPEGALSVDWEQKKDKG
jgi:uncharacterized membrane protein YhiD involved in acid resistance